LPFKMPEGEVIGSNGFEFSKSSSQAINLGSVLSNGSTIDKDTLLQNSLIMTETNIGKNCKIINSVIGCNVKIGDFCSIENCVIGDDVIIESNTSIKGEKLD